MTYDYDDTLYFKYLRKAAEAFARRDAQQANATPRPVPRDSAAVQAFNALVARAAERKGAQP